MWNTAHTVHETNVHFAFSVHAQSSHRFWVAHGGPRRSPTDLRGLGQMMKFMSRRPTGTTLECGLSE